MNTPLSEKQATALKRLQGGWQVLPKSGAFYVCMVPPDESQRQYVGSNVLINLYQRGLVRKLNRGQFALTRRGEAFDLGPWEEEDAEEAEEDTFGDE